MTTFVTPYARTLMVLSLSPFAAKNASAVDISTQNSGESKPNPFTSARNRIAFP